jgi:hypothetical protein
MKLSKNNFKSFVSLETFSSSKKFNRTKRKEYLNNALKFSFSEENNNKTKNSDSSIIPYIPIRPLRKHLTPLYVNDRFLNQG